MIRKHQRPKRNFPITLLIACCLASLSIAGCKKTAEPPQTAQPPAQTAQRSPEPSAPPAAELPYTFPLTGLPAAAKAEKRPFMIMVENSPAARPQSGLDQADIVYEVLAEGEITRFLTVFQSESPDVIGPVRSIRPYFVEIGEGLDAVLVHAGWSQDAMNKMVKLKASHLDELYGDGASYWRSPERKPPHNLYTSAAKAAKGAERRKFRMEWNDPHFQFAAAGQTGQGQTALKVEIPYEAGYKVAYEYDEAQGVYKRIMAGKPHLDKETGKQLVASNVLVIAAKHRTLDKAGRRGVDVYGPGKGYLIQQGKMQEITWERKQGAIRAYKDGQEVPLLPGKTWVQIVPLGTVVAAQ
jgi:hypothetical protein